MSYLLSHGLNLVFCLVAKNQSMCSAALSWAVVQGWSPDFKGFATGKRRQRRQTYAIFYYYLFELHFLEKNIKLSNQNLTVFQWHKHNLSNSELLIWFIWRRGGRCSWFKRFKKKKEDPIVEWDTLMLWETCSPITINIQNMPYFYTKLF